MKTPLSITGKNLEDPKFISLLAGVFDIRARIYSAGAKEVEEGQSKEILLAKRDRCFAVVDALVDYANVIGEESDERDR